MAAAAGEQLKLTLALGRASKAQAPKARLAKQTMAATNGRKVCKAVAACVAKFRPDLKEAAKRRAAAVQKSLRAGKAAAKKAASA